MTRYLFARPRDPSSLRLRRVGLQSAEALATAESQDPERRTRRNRIPAFAGISGVLVAALLVAHPSFAQPQPKLTPKAGAVPPVLWTYGEHPLWGPSAHVTAGEHSVGLRCLTPKGEGPVVAVAFTPKLVAPGQSYINYKIQGTQAEGGYQVENKGKYVEGAGTTCGISLDEFQKGRALILDDGAEKTKVLGRIPLAGAKAAIAKLLAACPAMRKDMENCGF
jgi:hypothetical protein